MDNIAVISNPETKDKRGFSSYGMYPRFSILDPAYTFTVPRSQTAAGTADIMSHIMESYFDQVRGASVQDGPVGSSVKNLHSVGAGSRWLTLMTTKPARI